MASIFILAFLFLSSGIFAQEDLGEICQWEKIKNKPVNLSSQDYESLLKKCQAYYQEKSKSIEADINKTAREKNVLSNKIYLLKSKIQNLNYKIYQGNIVVRDLKAQMQDTQSSIDKTNSKIQNIKENLANILELRYENDQRSLVEIFLSQESLAGAFNDLMALELLNSKTQDLLNDIKNLKSGLEKQKSSMNTEKENLERIMAVQTLQKQQNARTKQEQEVYLKMTEAEYQKHLKEKAATEQKVSAIRARIFALIGVPKAPTFGEALKLAEYVESITKVRPAFLLAILTQESNIGMNVGQCNLRNSATGLGVRIYDGKQIARVMNPKRDIKPFFSITKELGRDPYHTPVSCPLKYGYGGAMGPGQFIPSTWVIYREKVKAITGKPADPWNIKDSFLATALYLKDYGAARQTFSTEWRAAMIYFSGTSRRTVYNGYGFYGDSVMTIAKRLQGDITMINSSK